MTARLVLTTAATALLCAGSDAAEHALMPRLVGDWWTVAGDPDLGRLTTPTQQPVDFGIWQAADGTWQLWSCIRGTKEPGKTRLFHRWEGAQLTDRDWIPKGIAFQADPVLGETGGGLQAPYVLRHDGKYWMFYGDWANICLATSTDGKTFARYRNPEGRPQLDFAGRVDTGRNTRDPMVRRIGNQWYCYYTAHPSNKGCDYARTSDDMLHWSEEHVVAARGKSGDGPYSGECPFVVEPQPGHLYLFRTQRYGKDAQTMVYHSQDPLDFGIDNDAEHYVTTLPVAAPEVFQHGDQWYMAALLPSLKGIQIARMEWVPKNEASILDLLGSDFQGGANKTYGMEFGDRTNVNYVYAIPAGALATMRASFELRSEPTEQMYLLLDARQNEAPLGCSIEISLNDTTLLSGPNGFPRVWHVRSFDIPKGVLKSGTNTLTIRNLEPAGAAGSPPWFMVSRCAIGPAGFALPRIINFRKYSVNLPAEARPIPEPLPPGKKPGFVIRGIKGWNWTAEQYLEEIPILAEYRMNFLMNCYLSNFDTDGKWVNKWWEPLSEKRRQDYIKIIRKCERYHINFCFSVHPQLASPRPLDPNKAEDVEAYFRHYAWAQEQGVKWFSVSLDDVSWGERGPGAGGAAHARLVNTIFDRLRRRDKDIQAIFCPVPYWGDGTKKEDREYLEALARDMHPEVYVFWTGDEVAPARMTAEAARSYKAIVKHRLVIWENYPVNDASPTMHLGPITGRDPELADIADGYMSNPLCPQNQINRIPLLTCADFAWNPAGYDPDRSIGQAVLHWGKTEEPRQILKELVELYPGAILAKPSSAGYRPVYSAVLAQFKDKLESHAEEAQIFVTHVEDVEQRMLKAFPDLFGDARKTLQQNIAEMKDTQRSSIPANLVRLQDNSLCDDGGPFLGLGVSYFQALRDAKYDRPRLNHNLALLASKGFNYVRVLSMVSWDGLEIAPVTFTNRFRREVSDWPDYWQQFRDLLDLAGQYGLRVEVTIFADAQHVMPNRSVRLAHLDGILANIAGREDHVMFLEVANEAWQNGFPGAEGVRDLRAFTKYLADRTQVLIATTSNDDTSDQGIIALYEGSAADLATVHFSRETRTPEGRWLPVRDSYRAGKLPGVPPVMSNEPIGPGSSIAAESDPIRLCSAAVFAYLANLPGYVFHSRTGIYGYEKCCPPSGNRMLFEDTPGIDAFCHLRHMLPPDLASWSRNDGIELRAPFTVFCNGEPNRYWPEARQPADGCVRNIGGRQGGEFVCLPMGILGGGVTLEARHAVRCQVFNPLTGTVFTNLTLAAAERFALPQGPGTYIIKGSTQ
jgi:hypothetical protein